MADKERNPEVHIQQLRYALDNVPAYVYMKDANLRYLYANKLTLELFSCCEKELVGRSDDSFFPPETVIHLREVDLRVLEGEHTQEEIVVVNPDSTKTVYWEVKTPIYKEGSSRDIVGILGISTDITQRKVLEEQLLQAATLDHLTGVPNRRLFIDRLKKAMKKSNRLKSYSAVVFIDLDRFKTLNDTHGHKIGDYYLVEVARRITEQVREYDTVARYGGDEFVVLLEDLSTEESLARKNAEAVVSKIQNSINGEFSFSGIHYQGSCSLGLSLFSGSDRSIDDLLAEADQLMYVEKWKGK